MADQEQNYYDANGQPLSKDKKNYYDVNGKLIDLSVGPKVGGEKNYGTMATPQDIEETAKTAAPYIGRFAASSLPAIGGIAGLGAPGVGVGIAAQQALKNLAPDTFGEPAGFDPQGAIDIGADFLGQHTIPKILEKIAAQGMRSTLASTLANKFISQFPSVREGIGKEMSKQAFGKFQYPESQILESAAENANTTRNDLITRLRDATELHKASDAYSLNPNSSSPEMQSTLGDLQAKFGKNKIAKSLVKLDKEFQLGEDISKSQTYKTITNTALSDLTHVRNFKLATGEPETISQLALSKLVTKGFKSVEGKIDSTGILNELNGPMREVYEEAIGPSKLNTFRTVLDEIENQKNNPSVEAILRYRKSKLMLSAGAAALGGTTGAVLGGIAITDSVLGKLMANPQTAKLVVLAMKTKPTAPEADFITKALINTIRGAEVPLLVPQQ